MPSHGCQGLFPTQPVPWSLPGYCLGKGLDFDLRAPRWHHQLPHPPQPRQGGQHAGSGLPCIASPGNISFQKFISALPLVWLLPHVLRGEGVKACVWLDPKVSTPELPLLSGTRPARGRRNVPGGFLRFQHWPFGMGNLCLHMLDFEMTRLGLGNVIPGS